MKLISKSLLNRLINFRFGNLKKGIAEFEDHKDIYLPDSQEKIEEIIQGKIADEELLFEILNHDYIRPAFVIQDNNFKVPEDHPWAKVLATYKKNLLTAVKSVGVFEIERNGRKYPSGTGWVLSDDLVVTNQHVAEIFCQKTKSGYRMKRGFEQVTIDFNEEFERVHDFEFKVLGALHIEDDDTSLYNHTPDIAILRVEKVNKNGESLPAPLKLYQGKLELNQLIAIIGFPSADYKLPIKRKRIFNNIYDVKRLQPGLITKDNLIYDFDFRHDCATLTGNSGSPVIDISTGTVIGTHFAGSLNVFEGYAVRVDVLRKILHNI